VLTQLVPDRDVRMVEVVIGIRDNPELLHHATRWSILDSKERDHLVWGQTIEPDC
jgi:hypothetical protein